MKVGAVILACGEEICNRLAVSVDPPAIPAKRSGRSSYSLNICSIEHGSGDTGCGICLFEHTLSDTGCGICLFEHTLSDTGCGICLFESFVNAQPDPEKISKVMWVIISRMFAKRRLKAMRRSSPGGLGAYVKVRAMNAKSACTDCGGS